MKKTIAIIIAIACAICLWQACSPDYGEKTTTAIYYENTKSPNRSTVSKSFTNKYGTSTTKCAHSGCNNYIASSGDTNCCTKHSRKCLECGCYIDEDAMYCLKCLTNAFSK